MCRRVQPEVRRRRRIIQLESKREPKRLTRVTQHEISVDVSELVYWRTGKESRKRQFESLGAERDVLDS